MTHTQAIEEGMRLAKAGRLREAETLYRQVLAQHPGSVAACNNLGIVLEQQGRLAEAEQSYRRAIETKGDSAEALTNLGSVCRRRGSAAEAAEALGRAVAIKPDHARAHGELGMAYCDLRQWPAAEASLRRAVELRGDYAAAYLNLGVALRQLGRLEESAAAGRRAVEVNPSSADAHNSLGNALAAQFALPEAAEALRAAIRLQPRHVNAVCNLANVLCVMEQYDEAMELYRQAIALRPGIAEIHNNYANALKDQGRLEEAIEQYRRALQIKPAFVETHSNLLHAMVCCGGYDAKDVFEEHVRWGRMHAPVQSTGFSLLSDRTGGQQAKACTLNLRIGYVSPDFRRHSVASFIEPLIAAHRRERVSVVCYSDVVRADRVTERIRTSADLWRNVAGVGDEEFRRLVGEDGIDILVDLAGHTANNRLVAMASRAAPVQASYLGYPATTGVSGIDWRITDGWVDPAGESESYYTERLMRLPRTFLCYQPAADAPEVVVQNAARPLTFASFNNFAKVTAQTIEVWASILREAPGSRLLIKANGLASRSAQQRVREMFARHDVASSRIELRGHDPSFQGHLGLYGQVDVALDTFPYNGTTTTCEALWMGVPVVSLAGASSVSRVGASILSSIGLGELVAGDAAGYVRKAMELAESPQRRGELRGSMRERMRASPLMDAASLAGAMEEAFAEMIRTTGGGAVATEAHGRDARATQENT